MQRSYAKRMLCTGKTMSYYLLVLIIAAVFSFYLAIRNERKFQKKLNELDEFRSEIKEISARLEKLNNRSKISKEKSKIVFHSSYQIMDFNLIKNDDKYSYFCEDELELINSYFAYGKEKLKSKHKTKITKHHNNKNSYGLSTKHHSFA